MSTMRYNDHTYHQWVRAPKHNPVFQTTILSKSVKIAEYYILLLHIEPFIDALFYSEQSSNVQLGWGHLHHIVCFHQEGVMAGSSWQLSATHGSHQWRSRQWTFGCNTCINAIRWWAALGCSNHWADMIMFIHFMSKELRLQVVLNSNCIKYW